MNVSWVVKGTQDLDLGVSYFQADTLDKLGVLVKENNLAKALVYDGNIEGRFWYPSRALRVKNDFYSLMNSASKCMKVADKVCQNSEEGKEIDLSVVHAQLAAFESIKNLFKTDLELTITLKELESLNRGIVPWISQLEKLKKEIIEIDKEPENNEEKK